MMKNDNTIYKDKTCLDVLRDDGFKPIGSLYNGTVKTNLALCSSKSRIILYNVIMGN